MHILISCFGSAGDVYPFLAIGQALRQRGHEVSLLASPYFQQRIEAAGLGYIQVGTLEDYHRAVADTDLWHPRRSFSIVWQHMRVHLRAAYQQVLDHARSDTVLVGSTLAWSSRMAQEKLGLPGVTVHLSPSCLFSAHDPAIWPGLGWLRSLPTGLVRPLQSLIERVGMDPVVLPGLNALRAELGLPPTRRVMSHWANSPQKVICAFPDWFAALQPDWPANTITTDFPRWNASTGAVLDPMLARFLQSGPPPVGITPGSAMAHGRPVFERALAACDALGLRAVLITPYRDQLPEKLPAFARHVNYVPFDLLLPKLAAFVHHGGIGTLAQSLAAGVPQLITPFAHDQFDNAARLEKLGAGRSIAPLASTGKWIKALHGLVGNEDIADACHRWALQSHGDVPAAVRIAEQIETLRPVGTQP
ncbi:glycosyltransferase [Chitinimonas naiadis]